MKFKQWFLQENTGQFITPNDIYDFYYIATGISRDLIKEEDVPIAKFKINEIAQKYTNQFNDLNIEQLKKYIDRGRYVGDMPNDLENPENIHAAMQRTYRSDMQRKNVNWENITLNVKELNQTGVVDRQIYYIDRINNAIHNTGETILSKLPGGNQLWEAFENVHHAKTPKEYARYVSPDIRSLYWYFW